MAEVAPSAGGGGGNRTFLLLIAGLAALFILGALVFAAIIFLPALFGGGNTNIAQVTATPTRISIPPTATRTALPSPTLVVVAQITTAATGIADTPVPLEETATPIAITATPIAITATPGPGSNTNSSSNGSNSTDNKLPNTGLGEDLLMLFGGGLLLLGVIVVVRRMRSA